MIHNGGIIRENFNQLIDWIQDLIMQSFHFLHIFFSLLAFCYLILTTMASLTFGDIEKSETTQDNPIQPQSRNKRGTTNDVGGTKETLECGATALRLNLDLKRLYGTWFPVEASQSAYILWMTSLYGVPADGRNIDDNIPKIGCLTMELNPGSEEKTLDVTLNHDKKSVQVQAALLGDAYHPGTSKWVISFPNGEDTLTSIVATGTGKGKEYEWMLTVDCDLNGKAYPDWAIFTRNGGISNKTLGAIKNVVEGIAGLRMNKIRKQPLECNSLGD